MPTKARTPTRRTRTLTEQVAGSSPLRVDREQCVAYRVRVLGRFSRNSHGLREAANGTDYSPCMGKAVPLYEGIGVNTDHPEAGKAAKSRSVYDALGVLKAVRIEPDATGEPAVWADLHCVPEHPMTPRVLSDAEKGIGTYGLSHNATSAAERFDAASKRLVIEELDAVRSVDLVLRPATGRTLWESETVKTTLREVIEGLTLTPKRAKWRRHLLEDDALAPAMDAPMDAPAAGEEGDAAWAGFMQEIEGIGEKFKSGEMDAKTAGKKVMAIFKAHDSLFGEGEPETEPEADDADGDGKPDVSESLKENAVLKHRLAVRELCEELTVAADKTLLESLEALDLPKARKLLEREKARGTGTGRPRGSGFTPGGKGKPGRKVSGQSFVDAITE